MAEAHRLMKRDNFFDCFLGWLVTIVIYAIFFLI